jgi:hypothetical protein
MSLILKGGGAQSDSPPPPIISVSLNWRISIAVILTPSTGQSELTFLAEKVSKIVLDFSEIKLTNLFSLVSLVFPLQIPRKTHAIPPSDRLVPGC